MGRPPYLLLPSPHGKEQQSN